MIIKQAFEFLNPEQKHGAFEWARKLVAEMTKNATEYSVKMELYPVKGDGMAVGLEWNAIVITIDIREEEHDGY